MASTIENELDEFLNEQPHKTASEATRFLIKMLNSNFIHSSSKYATILNYFINNLFDRVLNEEDNIDAIKEILQYEFPKNSIPIDCIDEVVKKVNSVLKNKTMNGVALSLSILSNETFREHYKNRLKKYCKFIKSVLEVYTVIDNPDKEILGAIIQELHYFARHKNFRENFIQQLLSHFESDGQYIEKCDMGRNLNDLIKAILFPRSSLNEEEFKADMEYFFEQIALNRNRLLIEAYLSNFKTDATKILQLIRHFNDSPDLLLHITTLYSSLKKHNIDMSSLRKIESSLFQDISEKVIAVDNFNSDGYFEQLEHLISSDPFLFVDNLYSLTIDCMMKSKSSFEEIEKYEQLLSTIVKVFGKDINQFVKKLLAALNSKLKNSKELKKRKRKSDLYANESKKQKLSDGSSKICDENFNDLNIWPNTIKEVLSDIFSEMSVSQTTNLLKILNEELQHSIDEMSSSSDENILFKIDIISTIICQIFNSSRIHEHLIYKRAEIISAIEEFNKVQHNFYETIIKIEYNNRIMKAFLKMSYDYENFMMLYFYHYDEDSKSELDSVFIADNSRIKSNEWKIIQQRIKNFGRIEEKHYSNLLMLQHLFKNKIFKIADTEDDNKIIQNILIDKEQLNMLMEYKDTRLLIFSLLNEDMSLINLVEYFYIHTNEDEKFSFILRIIENNQKMLDYFIQSMLKVTNDSEIDYFKVMNILNQLPISSLTRERKKMIIMNFILKIDKENFKKIDHNVLINIFENLFKNDGYKEFSKDFELKDITSQIKDIDKYERIYEIIIRNYFKKMTTESKKSIDMIINGNSKVDLLDICGKIASEINIVATNECTEEVISNMKLELISKLLSQFNDDNISERQNSFYIFSKLCVKNMTIISEDVKIKHTQLMSMLLKSIDEKTTPSDKCSQIFMMTLKDAKKLNLDDELKGDLVKVLTKYLKSVIKEKLSTESYDEAEKEKELMVTLNSFKSNYREEFSQTLFALLVNTKDVACNHLIYSFKLFEILFGIHEKNNSFVVKNYMKFCDTFIHAKAKDEITNIDLLCAIYNAYIAMMKYNKEQLDSYVIDHVFTFYIDTRNRPSSSDNVEDFCKFNETIGQFFFVLSNLHQQYVKSRIPQYFKAYTKFLNEIYFYKADMKEDFQPKEISMLSRLTLQLENIMKCLIKYHSMSFTVISPYIMSSIVNVFVKNPKMLSMGNKFKVNIKNICYQLLSTFDDRARKHLYAASDELSRDVYENLFTELKRRG